MAEKKQLNPPGLWPSLITPEMTSKLLEFNELYWNENGCLFWKERTSNQTGIYRYYPESNQVEFLTPEINVGGGIGYGGGSFTAKGNSVIFVEKGSNQFFLLSGEEGQPHKITTSLSKTATPKISPSGNYLAFIHSDGTTDTIQVLDLLNPANPHPLVSGSDFYNSPRWHPDGSHLAWISWDHPHMPWDSSSLFLGDLEGNLPTLKSDILIAGGEGISVIQPEFSPDGRFLAYVSDQNGWWQIYIRDLDSGKTRQLTHAQAEHALPPWLQDQRTFGFSSDSQRIFFLRNQAGHSSLWQVDLETAEELRIHLDEEYTWLEDFAISPLDNQIALVASRGDIPHRLITVTLDGKTSILRTSAPNDISRNLFSLPKPISWPGVDEEIIHGLFYPPSNPSFSSKDLPPLFVIIHSGPTRQKRAEYEPRAQFFSSRGYGVLIVNYRGSTGYGRDYRQSLKRNWGVLDVDDCLSGAKYAASQGWIDPKRMFLFGSSSGGLTVLQILAKHPGVFRAGITLYAITNHLDLLKNPPKFERYYADWLLGPYPEYESVYRERSPLFSADKIRDPIAVFQGGKDPIVPATQAEQIVSALRENGIPHEYYLYPDESHGFKRIENVEDSYRKADAFLRKYGIST
ncbi:MAG: S9 family peptidase [Anaerolineales bacterium]|nr:S9 family peptidase [Anaerolineales bacterium]